MISHIRFKKILGAQAFENFKIVKESRNYKQRLTTIQVIYKDPKPSAK